MSHRINMISCFCEKIIDFVNIVYYCTLYKILIFNKYDINRINQCIYALIHMCLT